MYEQEYNQVNTLCLIFLFWDHADPYPGAYTKQVRILNPLVARRNKTAQQHPTHETVTASETGPCKMMESTAKRDVEEPDTAHCDKPANQSNGPRVTLGQSNRSPCSSQDYTKGRGRGQDEHPCMKRVPERVDKSGGQLVTGGPGHLFGVGVPYQKINAQARGHICQTSSQQSQLTSQEISNQNLSLLGQSNFDTFGGGAGMHMLTGTECNILCYETDEGDQGAEVQKIGEPGNQVPRNLFSLQSMIFS